MRGMFNRQANPLILLLTLLAGLGACVPINQPVPSPSPLPPTLTPVPPTLIIPPTPRPTASSTPTPDYTACLDQPGVLEHGEVPTEGLPTSFIIYLPPCYKEFPSERYPVLYLLHGQTYTADQWVRLGALEAADALIHTETSLPFIMVFPEDRYWNLQQGTRFGQYLLNDIIPYIDSHYRTIADRAHRSIGGLSRGGGWAFEVATSRPDLFGSLGLHSPAILSVDRPGLEKRVRELPASLWPRLFIDMGDNDRELEFNQRLESLLTQYTIPHEWHLNTGAHDEKYWSAHILEYIQWYTEGWTRP